MIKPATALGVFKLTRQFDRSPAVCTLHSRRAVVSVRLLTLCFLLAPALRSQTGSTGLNEFSSASYQPVVSPGSLATAFGSNLSTASAVGQLGPDGQFPILLNGTTLVINGEVARLLYVSPTQINFLVPTSAKTGMATVGVTSATRASVTGTVTVTLSAPALFSADGSGQGEGSILNAVTFASGPFSVTTPQNTGDDMRTRLAIFGTGIRFAGNTSMDPNLVNVARNLVVDAIDIAGNSWPLQVEYAGAAPGFAGLDQINAVLPQGIDGVGIVGLTVTAGADRSNQVTLVVPSSATPKIPGLKINSISLDSTSTRGGDTVSGTLTLSVGAPDGGLMVALQSSNHSAALPQTFVSIPRGATSARFSVSTYRVSVVTRVLLQAKANESFKSLQLTLNPAGPVALSGFTFSSRTVRGGNSILATLSFSDLTPQGGVNVGLQSSESSIVPATTVTVPAATNNWQFSIPTNPVANSRNITVTATYRQESKSATITVSDDARIAPTLLSPRNGAILPQNTPDNGCPSTTSPGGSGAAPVFTWTASAGATRYNLYVKGGNAKFPLVDVIVNGTTYKDSCGGFVHDANLGGWFWYVRALYPDGSFEESSTFYFSFAPCRLSDGTPCHASDDPAFNIRTRQQVE